MARAEVAVRWLGATRRGKLLHCAPQDLNFSVQTQVWERERQILAMPKHKVCATVLVFVKNVASASAVYNLYITEVT